MKDSEKLSAEVRGRRVGSLGSHWKPTPVAFQYLKSVPFAWLALCGGLTPCCNIVFPSLLFRDSLVHLSKSYCSKNIEKRCFWRVFTRPSLPSGYRGRWLARAHCRNSVFGRTNL